jgi:hypothetical protein
MMYSLPAFYHPRICSSSSDGLTLTVYLHHAAFDRAIPLPPLGTKDADMTVPLPLPVIAGITLHRLLIADLTFSMSPINPRPGQPP